MTSVLVGVGTAAYLPCDLAVPLLDGHPTAQAGFQLMLDLDDDVITHADVRVGLMHRSMEKLYEVRDYRQLMMLANRQDWMSAVSTEILIALTIETAMGIVVPERATWIRTMMAEATRTSALLSFLAPVITDAPTAETVRRLGIALTAAQEAATGSRVHPMHTRIGGVASDLDIGAVEQYQQVAGELDIAAPAICAAAAEAMTAFAGQVTVTRDDAVTFALLGPVGRASGLDRDVRIDEPYLAYGDLRHLLVYPRHTDGDIPARYAAFTDQIAVSAHLMQACLDQLSTLNGPVGISLPKVVRVPEGTHMSRVEGPLGQSGCVVVSTGDKTPSRIKMRAPSFACAQALGPALVGTSMGMLAEAVMSFFIAVGDIDR